MVQFTVPLSIIVVVIVIVIVIVVAIVVAIVVVIETANWLYKSIDYDNDKRFADNDNEGGRQNDTHASMVLNQAPFFKRRRRDHTRKHLEKPTGRPVP